MNPSTLHDTFFGVLKLDNDSYEGEITISTLGTVKVSILVENEEAGTAIARAQGALPPVLINEPICRRKAVMALLGGEENLGDINVEPLTAPMVLEEISFLPDSTNFWYHDGGLFGGREIRVVVDREMHVEVVGVSG